MCEQDDEPVSGPDFDEDYWLSDEDDRDTCPHCGKEYEEFGDLGCEYCDARHPGFGTLD